MLPNQQRQSTKGKKKDVKKEKDVKLEKTEISMMTLVYCDRKRYRYMQNSKNYGAGGSEHGDWEYLLVGNMAH